MISPTDILAKLDEAAADYSFPVLNNVEIDLAAIWMTAFRNSDEWLIVFQQIAFAAGFHGFADAISAYGNSLKVQGVQRAIAPVSFAGKGDSSKLNIHDFAVRVHKSRARHFNPSVADYRSAHVDVDDESRAETKILRYLASRIGDDLHVSDDVLLRTCKRNSARLKKFMELDKWHHPDVADDERPSNTACFKSLARALARGDASLYKCNPASFNTGWWQWPRLD